MNWWLAAGSLAAVLMLAGIAKLLGLGGAQRIESGADAIRLAEALTPGFEGKAGVVSASGELAAATDGAGDLVLIEPMGARHRARRIGGARAAMLDEGPNGIAITLQLAPGEMFRLTVADRRAAHVFAQTLSG